MPAVPQIVVGVLEKYVNLAQRWRRRVFVVQRGVLRYYRVSAAPRNGAARVSPACFWSESLWRAQLYVC